MSAVTCQLAHDIDVDTFKGVSFPLWGFAKVDGVRAVHVDSFTGRSMDPFKNHVLNAKFSDPMYAGFDGELTINGYLTNAEVQDAISDGVLVVEDDDATLCSLTAGLTGRSKLRKGEEALPDNVVWNLFDWLDDSVIGLMYCERYMALATYLNGRRPHPHVRLLPYEVIENAEQARAFIARKIAEGYEGAVFRDPKALHKSGRPGKRDNDFWRFKPTSDKDAYVIGLEEAMENQNEAKKNALGKTERSSSKAGKVPKGMIGNLICRDFATGEIIKVPAGKMKKDFATAAFLDQSLIVGHPIKYESLDTGVKNAPRQARFISIRAKADLLPHELALIAEWEREAA